MLILRKKRWEMPEREATPEALFLNRRVMLAGAGAALFAGGFPAPLSAADEPDPSAGLYPVKRNEKFTIEGAVTPEAVNSHYNNFYEFGTTKDIYDAAQSLKVRPWSLKIDGMVEKPQQFAIDDLLKLMPLEERLYRHRCVEAWSMAIPWSGFPLKALVDLAKPLGSAKFVQMTTFMDPKMAPGQRQFFYPWPYVEGLTMAEAANDLAFMVTGAYGKPLGKSFGAPLRLAVPWKYGFKSIKSITKISFVETQPKTFWEALQYSEYGFWANVNPEVPHPRWSQASEEVIGTSERRPTQLFNGYAPEVASLYAGMPKDRLYM